MRCFAFIAGLLATLLLAVAAASTANAAIANFNVYATGVDNTGNRLAAGTIDPHYFSKSWDGGKAYVLSSGNYWNTTNYWNNWALTPNDTPPTSPSDAWVVPPTGGQWINYHNYVVNSNGWHTLYTTFDLTGLDPSTAKLTFTWTSDNDSYVYLNGSYTNVSIEDTNGRDYTHLYTDTITSGFTTGINTLAFDISMDDYDGLLIQSISGTADQLPGAVPEPASLIVWSLLGCAGMGVASWRRRRPAA